MGTSRNTRASPALRPGWQPIDGRTPRQLIAQVERTAALFQYYDASNTRHGHWNAFYEEIALVRYAALAEIDVDRMKQLFTEELAGLGTTFQAENLGDQAGAWTVIDRLLLVYVQVDHAARIFERLATEIDYAGELRHAITGSLNQDLQEVLECREWLKKNSRYPYEQPGWPGSAALDPALRLRADWWHVPEPPPLDPPLNPTTFVRQLTRATWSTHATLIQLVTAAATWFDRRYETPAGLPPHFALYLAFVRQFAGAQQALNTLPERHLDYFYTEVLKLAPAGAVPDSLYVAFTAAPGTWTDLPAGTEVTAGNDANGVPIVYATKAETTVTPSVVAQFATVFLAPPGAGEATEFYAAPVANSADGLGAPLAPGTSWATFGEEQADLAPATRTMADGAIGFVVTSPTLHLEGGQRRIELVVAYTRPTETLTTIATPPSPPLAIPGCVDYSGIKGWVTVPAAQTTCTLHYGTTADGKVAPLNVTFTVTLGPGDPGCVNYDPKTLGPGFDARAPALRIRYANPLEAFPTADPLVAQAFAAAPVASAAIRVDVDALTPTLLMGPSGTLTTTKPAALFGSPVQPAGQFTIGSVELFRKQVTDLTVALDWVGLPSDANGLRDYFSSYLVAYSNPPDATFCNNQYYVLWSALFNGTWQRIDLPPAPPTPPTTATSAGSAATAPAAASAAATTSAPVTTAPAPSAAAATPSTTTPPPSAEVAAAAPAATPAPTTPAPSPETPAAAGAPSAPGSAPQPATAATPAPPAAPAASESPSTAAPNPPPITSDGRLLFDWKPYPARSTVLPTPSGQLIPNRSWDADVAALQEEWLAAPGFAGPLDPATSPTGFLRFELDAPDYLFGQPLYATVVSKIALENALAITTATKPPPPPPTPETITLTAAFNRIKASTSASWWTRFTDFLTRSKTTTYTFKPTLLPAVQEAGKFPPDVLAAVQATKLDPDTVFQAIVTMLSAKDPVTFTDVPTLQSAITSNLKLPSGAAGEDARDEIIGWFGCLLYKPPQPSKPDLLPLPRPPLVPTASNVRLSYTAQATLAVGASGATPPPWDRLWQVAPFATYPMPSDPTPLLPAVSLGGTLFIGLKNVQPPETISLLFVLESLPAPQLPAVASDEPKWSWLIGDTWQSADSSVHRGTEGFLRTGIVRIDLPPEIDTQHTTMPGGLVWVRAEVANPSAHLRTLQVLPHAAEADWVPPAGADNDALTAHFATPLPAGSITGLLTPNPAVTTTVQPLPASGGVPPETLDQFNTRVSERLRHKGRAVAGRDYERLLVQRFPTVFYASVVPPANAAAAGQITILVLPTVTVPPAAPPPGFVPGDLLAMAQALAPLAPLSAQIDVINPSYDVVLVVVSVKFKTDHSADFYRAELTSDLQAYIAPWIYRQATVTDPVVSFQVSDLSAFIASLPYVVQVGACSVPGWRSLVAPTSPTSLLVSAAQHQITLMS